MTSPTGVKSRATATCAMFDEERIERPPMLSAALQHSWQDHSNG